VTLETKDGVSLRATYYGGFNKKETVPVILIHGWEGARGEYDTLAKGLQQKGHAIIAPDLRGHGQSLVQKHADGTIKELDPEKFRQAELDAMVLDIEACKKFLMEKNNQGELNINALCVVGADFGTILALRWSALDLTAPPLLAFKQGQDVKALVLLTPMQSFKGLTIRDALSVPALKSELSMMIVAGKQDNKGTSEAKRLHTSLQSFHPKVKDDPEEIRKKQDLFLVQPETTLQGTKLLGSGLPVMLNIRNFIELRLVNRMAEFPWTDRKRGAD
jgi:alpha-beta hydrolase superfamily lysophospholipase